MSATDSSAVNIVYLGIVIVVVAIAAAGWFFLRPKAKQSGRIFEVLAATYRCPIIDTGKSGRHFVLNVHNRDFTVAECRLSDSSSAGASALGASGEHLVLSTPLKIGAWKQHAIGIRKSGWRESPLKGMTQKRSEDEQFDAEFSVGEQGDALPDGWLTKAVRSDVRAMFQLSMQRTGVFVEAGVVSFYVPLRGNELTPHASQEMFRRIGWLASGLDRAAAGDAAASDVEEIPDLDVVVTPAISSTPQGAKYQLSKNTFSVGGDYTITDGSGNKCYVVSGKVSLAATFDLLDLQKNVLFSGREHVLNLDQKFIISRDDVPQATMLRRAISNARKVFGSPAYAYDVERVTGEKFTATGTFIGDWKLTQNDAVVATVATDGHVSDITIPSTPRDLPFILTVIVAIVRLNPPPRSADSTNSA